MRKIYLHTQTHTQSYSTQTSTNHTPTNARARAHNVPIFCSRKPRARALPFVKCIIFCVFSLLAGWSKEDNAPLEIPFRNIINNARPEMCARHVTHKKLIFLILSISITDICPGFFKKCGRQTYLKYSRSIF